jgi:type IV pilus assembly protein PilB
MKRIVQKPLGELFIDSKLITQEQLAESLKVQQEKGGLIGQILVNLGYVSEEDVAKALMVQYGIPYMPLENYEIDKEVSKLIPENVARQYGVLAVDKVGSILTIVMSNPLNSQAIEDIEMMTKLKMQVFVATVTDVNHALNDIYKK